jgi:hypothetical protein
LIGEERPTLAQQTTAHWLQKAEEARARADELHDPAARESMLDIAAKYDVMAQHAEGREVRARTRAEKGGGAK